MALRFLFVTTIALLQISHQEVFGIPLSEFYPFGEDAGDSLMDRTLDGSSPLIKLHYSVFPFYGQEYEQLYVRSL